MLSLVLLLIVLPFTLGSIALLISKKFPNAREIMAISITAIEMLLALVVLGLYLKNGETTFELSSIATLGLSFKVDGFRTIYATVSIFLWLMTITFSKEYMLHYDNKDRYYFFYLLTLSGVVGVFYSADLITTFIFFEIMSFASYPLVIHDEKEASMKAGEVYLWIAIITGMVLLMGLFVLYSEIKSVDIDTIRTYVITNGLSPKIYASGILMLVGFGAKAGMYPLHIWLPKAHPVAPAPASALLSGILTKAGVYGIILISANIFFANYSFGILLLVFAVITMFLGALLALFSVDLKRTLACSSMSQIGFILVGISFMVLLKEEGSLAALGAMLHMVNHSLIKLVLFMASGVVAKNLHTLDLNKAKGFGRKKPFLMIVFLIGALGIMGIPLFNGYVSKTMIHEAIVEYINIEGLTGGIKIAFKAVEYIFLASGGLTVAYMSKLFICLFVEKNNDEELQKKYDNMKSYLSPLSKVVFVISTIALPLIGILPNIIGVGLVNLGASIFNVEALSHHIHFFSFECLKGGVISIVIGAMVYLLIVRKLLIKNGVYLNVWPEKLDLETLVYRPIINIIVIGALYGFKVFAMVTDFIIYLLSISVLKPGSYHFDEHTLSYKIGALIDKLKKNDNHEMAEKSESFVKAMFDVLTYETTDFSFALSMICLGMILILAIALIF